MTFPWPHHRGRIETLIANPALRVRPGVLAISERKLGAMFYDEPEEFRGRHT